VPKKPFSENELLEKAASYCAYQERSEADLRKRLRTWEAPEDLVEKVITQLREENFINDRRFAQAFTRGRFTLKKWGRIKIRYALLQHGITSDLAEECIYTIDEELYIHAARDLLESRMRKITTPTLKDKSQLFNYMRGKGYEYDLINTCWEERFPDC